jgi:serine/threonine protein kinase
MPANYRRIEQIASGAFGEVWRAQSGSDGGAVALKLIHEALLADGAQVRRFQREIELCSKLDHPNIVPIIDFGTTDAGTPYYVMPLVNGQSLYTQLRELGPRTAQESRKLFSEVCAGIEAAHAQHIIHRDIKSSNVVIRNDGTAQVCDFGLAKLLGEGTSNLTRSREIVGTPACMAPEQALGDPVDHRADIYSLGVLLYELFAGALPFSESCLTVLTQLHCFAQRPTLPMRADLPEGLNEIIGKAMAVEPGKRYQTVAELRKAACQLLDPSDEVDSVPSCLLFVADPTGELAESEDMLDAFEDEFQALGAQTVLRGSRRLVLAIQLGNQDAGSLMQRAQTIIGGRSARASQRCLDLLWQNQAPVVGSALDFQWP